MAVKEIVDHFMSEIQRLKNHGATERDVVKAIEEVVWKMDLLDSKKKEIIEEIKGKLFDIHLAGVTGKPERPEIPEINISNRSIDGGQTHPRSETRVLKSSTKKSSKSELEISGEWDLPPRDRRDAP